MKRSTNGFTITETIVSLLLISISSIFIMKCMMVSLNGLKNTGLRFSVERAVENRKNFILGLPHDSPQLIRGTRQLRSGDIRLTITVSDRRTGLKQIRITGRLGKFTSGSVFYKSGIIREGEYE